MTVHDDTMAVLEEWRKSTAELKRTADFLENALPHLVEVSSIAKSLGEIVLSLNFQRANASPRPRETAPPQGNSPAPLKSADTSPVSSAMNWKPFPSGQIGHWCKSEENLPLKQTLLAAPNKTLELQGFRYRLSGDKDMFLQRFPAGGGKA